MLLLAITLLVSGQLNDCFGSTDKIAYSNANGMYCQTGSTTASDVSCTGCVSSSELASSYGGAGSCSSNQWVTAVNNGTTPSCVQPGFSNLSGTASAAQLPAPTASAKGGISGTGSSLTCPVGQFVSGFTSGGAIICTAPALSLGVTSLSRSLNTNFTPSATNIVNGKYYISFSCSISLTTGQSSTVELRADTNTTPTTARGTIGTGNTGSLTVGLSMVNSSTILVDAWFPPGWNGRLVSNGTCTVTSVSATENTLSI